jgi:hypothetical protein
VQGKESAGFFGRFQGCDSDSFEGEGKKMETAPGY